LNEDVVTKVPALPLTSGIFTLNCVLFPLVNVKFLVPLSNDAVTNAKLADVFKDAVVELIFVILILADAEKVFNSVIEVTKLAVDCEAVNTFSASILTCCDAEFVFKLLTDVFKDAVVELILLIDTNADALNVFKLFIEVTIDAVDCEAVNVFNASILTC